MRASPGEYGAGRGVVLLVEDEVLVRDNAQRALAALGYRVLVAADGIDALEVFRASHASIDVVILDMIMPRMGGRATFRALMEIDPDVPVILTTGYARNEESEAILDLGVRQLVEKPYRIETLHAAIRGLIDGRALSARARPG